MASAKMSVKGHEFNAPVIKDSFNRRALQFKNRIITTLCRLGITDYDVEVSFENFAVKKAPASVTWFVDGRRLYYSYDRCGKFVENLYVVLQVVEHEVDALATGGKTIDEFFSDFSEDEDVVKKRKEAREVLGVSHDERDMEAINRKYKELARAHHPDVGGSVEEFKRINNAHKTLKRELE